MWNSDSSVKVKKAVQGLREVFFLGLTLSEASNKNNGH